MEKPKFEFYTRPSGHTEFQEYFDKLNPADQRKLAAVIFKTEQYGLQIAARQRWIRKLQDGIFELRTTGSDIQRGLYFHDEGSRFIVTHGFTKKDGKTPPAEIRHAQALRREYYDEKEGTTHGE